MGGTVRRVQAAVRFRSYGHAARVRVRRRAPTAHVAVLPTRDPLRRVRRVAQEPPAGRIPADQDPCACYRTTLPRRPPLQPLPHLLMECIQKFGEIFIF